MSLKKGYSSTSQWRSATARPVGPAGARGIRSTSPLPLGTKGRRQVQHQQPQPLPQPQSQPQPQPLQPGEVRLFRVVASGVALRNSMSHLDRAAAPGPTKGSVVACVPVNDNWLRLSSGTYLPMYADNDSDVRLFEPATEPKTGDRIWSCSRNAAVTTPHNLYVSHPLGAADSQVAVQNAVRTKPQRRVGKSPVPPSRAGREDKEEEVDRTLPDRDERSGHPQGGLRRVSTASGTQLRTKARRLTKSPTVAARTANQERPQDKSLLQRSPKKLGMGSRRESLGKSPKKVFGDTQQAATERQAGKSPRKLFPVHHDPVVSALELHTLQAMALRAAPVSQKREGQTRWATSPGTPPRPAPHPQPHPQLSLQPEAQPQSQPQQPQLQPQPQTQQPQPQPQPYAQEQQLSVQPQPHSDFRRTLSTIAQRRGFEGIPDHPDRNDPSGREGREPSLSSEGGVTGTASTPSDSTVSAAKQQLKKAQQALGQLEGQHGDNSANDAINEIREALQLANDQLEGRTASSSSSSSSSGSPTPSSLSFKRKRQAKKNSGDTMVQLASLFKHLVQAEVERELSFHRKISETHSTASQESLFSSMYLDLVGDTGGHNGSDALLKVLLAKELHAQQISSDGEERESLTSLESLGRVSNSNSKTSHLSELLLGKLSGSVADRLVQHLLQEERARLSAEAKLEEVLRCYELEKDGSRAGGSALPECEEMQGRSRTHDDNTFLHATTEELLKRADSLMKQKEELDQQQRQKAVKQRVHAALQHAQDDLDDLDEFGHSPPRACTHVPSPHPLETSATKYVWDEQRYAVGQPVQTTRAVTVSGTTLPAGEVGVVSTAASGIIPPCIRVRDVFFTPDAGQIRSYRLPDTANERASTHEALNTSLEEEALRDDGRPPSSAPISAPVTSPASHDSRSLTPERCSAGEVKLPPHLKALSPSKGESGQTKRGGGMFDLEGLRFMLERQDQLLERAKVTAASVLSPRETPAGQQSPDSDDASETSHDPPSTQDPSPSPTRDTETPEDDTEAEHREITL